jgi:hypothetical protein
MRARHVLESSVLAGDVTRPSSAKAVERAAWRSSSERRRAALDFSTKNKTSSSSTWQAIAVAGRRKST